MSKDVSQYDLLYNCPIIDELDADGKFLVAMSVAIGILADRAKEPELEWALEKALKDWAFDKGYIFR